MDHLMTLIGCDSLIDPPSILFQDLSGDTLAQMLADARGCGAVILSFQEYDLPSSEVGDWGCRQGVQLGITLLHLF